MDEPKGETMTKALYAVLICGLYVGLILEEVSRDTWRSIGFAACLAAFLVVRRDLTETP